jgi:hypothetical protein
MREELWFLSWITLRYRDSEKTNFLEADGKCPYARLPKPGTRPQGRESKRIADKSRGMRRKIKAQGARQKAEGKNQAHLHYLLSLSPEPYAFGHGISYAAVPPARRAYAPEGRGMRVTPQRGVFRQPHKDS